MLRLSQSAVRGAWARGSERSIPLIGEWNRYWSTKSGDGGENTRAGSPRYDQNGRGRGKAVEPSTGEKPVPVGAAEPRSDAASISVGFRKVGPAISLPNKLPLPSDAPAVKGGVAKPRPTTDLSARLAGADTSPKMRGFALPTSLDRLVPEQSNKAAGVAHAQPSAAHNTKPGIKVPDNLKGTRSRLSLPGFTPEEQAEINRDEARTEELWPDEPEDPVAERAKDALDELAHDVEVKRYTRAPAFARNPMDASPNSGGSLASATSSDRRPGKPEGKRGVRKGAPSGPVPGNGDPAGDVPDEESRDHMRTVDLSLDAAEHVAKAARARKKAAAFSLPTAVDVEPGRFFVGRLDHQIQLAADPNLEFASLLSGMPDPSKWEQRLVDRPSEAITAQLQLKIAEHKGVLVAEDGRSFSVDLGGVEAYVDAQVAAARQAHMPLLDANARAAPGGEDEQALEAIVGTVSRDNAARPIVDKYLTTIKNNGSWSSEQRKRFMRQTVKLFALEEDEVAAALPVSPRPPMARFMDLLRQREGAARPTTLVEPDGKKLRPQAAPADFRPASVRRKALA